MDLSLVNVRQPGTGIRSKLKRRCKVLLHLVVSVVVSEVRTVHALTWQGYRC